MDPPEMRPSTIMRIPRLVRNAISIDLRTNRTPEMRKHIQTHPYSGHFGNKFVDSLAEQTKRTRG